jgi:glycosyltransferase involved in cell wall biosynthesis
VVFHHPIFHFGTGWLERLKKLRFVFWPWDHFGKTYPDYFFFEGRCVRRVRYLLSVSEPMARVYDELWPRDSYSQVRRVLPLGVDAKIVERAPQDWQLGLVGNLRPEDGLLTTLDAMVLEPRLWLDVVGGGIHLDAFKKRAREVGVSDRVRFLGYVESSDRLLDIVSSWQVGLAPYHPTCYTAYADPGKIKHYLQLGLPIVTTSIVPMSEIVRQAGAGEAVPPSDVPALLAAIMKIRRGYDAYVRGVMNLRGRYEYRRLYDEGFSFMREPRE